MCFFSQICLLSSPQCFVRFLSKSLNLIGCCGDIKGKFSKLLKTLLLRNHMGMKLKVGKHALEISLFINCVFYSGRIRTLVAMATYSSRRLIMGKAEIDSFCCLICNIYEFSFHRYIYLVVLLVSYDICGDIKGKFSKILKKKFSSETIRGMKLKRCIHA